MLVPEWLIPLARQTAARHEGVPPRVRSEQDKTVVVIDADARSRAWYSGQLRQIGQQFTETGDASAAISFLQTQRSAIVLAHLSTLPSDDGIRLREYLARHREFTVVTTTGPHDDLPEGDDEGTAPITLPAGPPPE